MNPRIDQTIAALRGQRRTGLAAYLVAGDPDPSTTLAAMGTLVAHGAALLEVGMPFSDPVADGPVIAEAHERSLRGGQTLRGVFDLVARFRERDTRTPIVLMGYANPVLNLGLEAFFAQAARCGADGVIVVDLPLEHAGPWREQAAAHEVALVPLWAPTASEERTRRILDSAQGLLYVLTRTGITGADGLDTGRVKERVGALRRDSDIPLMTGFGIRDPDDARALADVVDLVVVGSRFVEILAPGGEAPLETLARIADGFATALEPR